MPFIGKISFLLDFSIYRKWKLIIFVLHENRYDEVHKTFI